ncbi:hypothetical protein [Aestuariivita boseongensis]|nr:hypothetical protein [Aestuariivita boseongensis]
MTRKDASSQRAHPVETVRNILSWIAETDRKFRMAQARIDQISDRF